MDMDFIRNWMIQLRVQKGVSESRMSQDLGHSKSYINNISCGKSLPSLPEFLAICDYLSVTPKEFFDVEEKDPVQFNQVWEALMELDEEDLSLTLRNISRLLRKK